MITVPKCFEIDFRDSEKVEGYAYFLLLLFRNLGGFNSVIEANQLQAIREQAVEWCDSVSLNIKNQDAKGIQKFLECYDWLYRIAYGAADTSGFQLQWNRTAFQRMLKGENADLTYFMRWIRCDSGNRTKNELTWFERILLGWRKDALGDHPFIGYLNCIAFRIGAFLICDSPKDGSLIPQFIRGHIVRHLVNMIEKRTPGSSVEELTSMHTFLMWLRHADCSYRDELLKSVLGELSQSEAVNPYSKEAYGLELEYLVR